jgi:uncharacterized damage-inducible protein DinB
MLWRYSRWANQLILSQAERVREPDYYAQAPGLSFGSLHATLVHILVGDIVWLARFNDGLPPEALKDARKADVLASTEVPTFEALITLWRVEEAKQAVFFEALTDAGVARQLSYQTQYGEPYTQPMTQLLMHLTNHGTQFRAEAAVRLTQLGLSPGDLDLIMYLRAGGA